MSVRHALLALLAERSRFGLQLKQDFEARTGEVWPLNVGQVYSTLQRLERDELVATDDTEGDAGQRVYRITPAGRGELDEWFHAAPGVTAPPRDDLVIRVLVALAVPNMDVAAVIQTHRRRLVEAMQHYTHLKAHDDDLALTLVADAELFRLDAAIRWLDAADTRLGTGARLRPLADPSPDELDPPAQTKTVPAERTSR